MDKREWIANIERGQNKFTGSEAREKVAKGLGLTYAELVRELEGSEPAPVPQRVLDRDDEYPSRRTAAIILRSAGVGEDVIEALMTASAESEADPGVVWWRDKGLEIEALMKDTVVKRAARDDQATAREPDLSDERVTKILARKKRGK